MIYAGLDDTDNSEQSGTGRVAREIAAILGGEFRIAGVTRHQLLVDPRVPCTSNNSCNVIHLDLQTHDLAGLADRIEPLLRERSLPGSDPGLCVAPARVAGHAFGVAAQQRLLDQNEALQLARDLGVILRPLGGTGDGVIGALAGTILAAGGNDGRFVSVGGSRDLHGVVEVPALAAAGVTEVRTRTGKRLTWGRVDTLGGRVRPLLLEGKPVLLVEEAGVGGWRVVEIGKRRVVTRD